MLLTEGGIRLANKTKRVQNDLPLLSIVTVVRNGEKFLEETILSVLNQTYRNIEYIIIDGNSTDRTLDIIAKYRSRLDHWLSETDRGIYDAMNKGAALCGGDYINFMNAGDAFYSDNTCKMVADELIKQNCDVIYGDTFVRNDNTEDGICVNAKPLTSIWKGMVFSHQSCFIRTATLKENTYDLRYKTAADFNQMLSLICKNKCFVYLPAIISCTRIGGLSYSSLTTVKEQIIIVNSLSPFSIRLLYYLYPLTAILIRKVLGESLTSRIRKIKWKYLPYSV